jgi:hypothetical protein
MTLPNLKWAPSPNFSERTARVDLIVIHDTEGAYAGAVAWFEQAASQVSAHYVVKEDGTEATQMVDLAKKAWHACLFNSRSVGIEMAGKESVGIDDRCWAATAAMTAYLLHHLQIPCKFAEGGTGPGFCRHLDLGQAGGGHNDPTTDPAVWAKFVAMVEAEYAKADFPALWTVGSAVTNCVLQAPTE